MNQSVNEERGANNRVSVKNLSKKFKIKHEKNSSSILSFISRKNRIEEITALDNISFDLNEGEVLGIIGRNGAGKSTLLKIIGKILVPTSGTVSTQGKISFFVSLAAGLHPDLSVKQNMILNGLIIGETKPEMEKKIPEAIKFAELGKWADVKIKDFSTGMIMRLALATALCVEPDIILIDEVLSIGDYAFQKKSIEKFLEFKKRGKSVILASHDLTAVQSFCDRVILLEYGKIVSSGPPSKVVNDYMEILKQKSSIES